MEGRCARVEMGFGGLGGEKRSNKGDTERLLLLLECLTHLLEHTEVRTQSPERQDSCAKFSDNPRLSFLVWRASWILFLEVLPEPSLGLIAPIESESLQFNLRK